MLNKGIPLLEKIGEGLGAFFGGVASGFLESATSSFPAVGTNLTDFMKNARGFFSGAKNIDKSTLEGINILASSILKITGAKLIEQISSFGFGASSMSEFGAELSSFGKAFAEYATTVKDIPKNVVENSAAAALTMAEFAKMVPNSGGVVSLFTGNNNLGKFGEGLSAFGKSFKEYSDNISGFSYSTVTNSAAAATTIAEFAKIVPNTGGDIGDLVGNNDLGKFGKGMASFGKSLMSYSDSLKGFSYSTVVNSAAAAQEIAVMAKTIANSGGVASLFAGDNTMDRFGIELAIFGAALKGYSNSVLGINNKAITDSATAATAIANLANIIPNSGGFKWLVEGDNNISTFGFYLKSFGQYLRDYSNIVADVNVEALASVTTQVRSLIALAQNMSVLDTTGMTGFGAALKLMAQDGLNMFITTFNDSGATIILTAQLMLTRFTLGMTLNKHKVTNMAIIIVSEALTAIKNKYNDYYQAGVYFVDGFANGITANTFKAKAVAKAMAEAALEAARKALDERSPSKETYEVGDYFGQGFVNAIYDGISVAYTAGGAMARASLTGINDAIKKVASVVSSDIDVQPSIRPVLDLSDIKTGAGLLTDLLSTKKAVRVNAEVEAGKTEIQNGSTAQTTTPQQIQFTQNNYSPKALSRIEIYRQTHNQISSLKEVLA